jgi:beta-phosphoglucomutase-like phosphatase (HAD superfamily)
VTPWVCAGVAGRGRLGVAPERCLVVEDSLIGLQAAVGADMPCIITYTPSTKVRDSPPGP